MKLKTFFFVALLLVLPAVAQADSVEPFQCEVLVLSGTVTAVDAEGRSREVKEGDRLLAGEVLEAGADSHADISYDRDWNNITRLEANSRMKIASIAPGQVDLQSGALFAKLKKLPQDSSFEVRTPTAVATVRGSEYRTLFMDGKTEVVNAAGSSVIVYSMLEDGTLDKDNAVRLRKDMKTSVESGGKVPQPPVEALPEEKSAGEKLSGGIEDNVKKAESEGRLANIQDVKRIETFIREQKKKATAPRSIPDDAELSRVTDNRRRAFEGGDKALAPPKSEDEEADA